MPHKPLVGKKPEKKGRLVDYRKSLIADRLQEVENNTEKLSRYMTKLNIEMECEKQFGRSKNFIVTIIPQDDKEGVPRKISRFLINIKKEDITPHRLPSTRHPAPIIVQCTTKAIRDEMVRKSRNFEPDTSLSGNVHPERNVFLNDHLTPCFS